MRLPYVPSRPSLADDITDIAAAVAGPFGIVCGLLFLTVIMVRIF